MFVPDSLHPDNSEVSAAIAAAARDQSGTCWWCGRPADSREHKYKKTDLKRMAQGDDLLWGGDSSELRTVRSHRKSKEVLFGLVLCKRCNDTRSQPFDRAYEIYAAYVSQNLNRLWRAGGIRFDRVYGEDWSNQTKNLARYFAKHFGCLIADSGFPPPDTLRNFLSGADDCPDVSMCLVKEEGLWLLHRELRRDSDTDGGLWISPGQGWMTENRLSGYKVKTSIGYVGVLFEWQENWGTQDSFFKHPHPVLNRRKASKELRRSFQRTVRGSRGSAS